jgi:stage V sporulation protein SpoVS
VRSSDGKVTRTRQRVSAGTEADTVLSAKNPKGPVPNGYKVVGTHAADIHDFVNAIVVARDNLAPQSKDYKVLTAVIDLLKQKGSSAITIKLAPQKTGQPSKSTSEGIVEVDLTQLRALARDLLQHNPASTYHDIFAALGAGIVGHEISHQRDFLGPFRGRSSVSKAEAFRSEVSGYTLQTMIFKNLNLNYPPVYTRTMTPAEVRDSIINQAHRSVQRDSTGGQ